MMTSGSLDSMEEYRAWCRVNVPEYLPGKEVQRRGRDSSFARLSRNRQRRFQRQGGRGTVFKMRRVCGNLNCEVRRYAATKARWKRAYQSVTAAIQMHDTPHNTRNKCAQCGLVNSASDSVCRRCGAEFDAEPVAVVETDEAPPKKSRGFLKRVAWIIGATMILLIIFYLSLLVYFRRSATGTARSGPALDCYPGTKGIQYRGFRS